MRSNRGKGAPLWPPTSETCENISELGLGRDSHFGLELDFHFFSDVSDSNIRLSLRYTSRYSAATGYQWLSQPTTAYHRLPGPTERLPGHENF